MSCKYSGGWCRCEHCRCDRAYGPIPKLDPLWKDVGGKKLNEKDKLARAEFDKQIIKDAPEKSSPEEERLTDSEMFRHLRDKVERLEESFERVLGRESKLMDILFSMQEREMKRQDAK